MSTKALVRITQTPNSVTAAGPEVLATLHCASDGYPSGLGARLLYALQAIEGLPDFRGDPEAIAFGLIGRLWNTSPASQRGPLYLTRPVLEDAFPPDTDASFLYTISLDEDDEPHLHIQMRGKGLVYGETLSEINPIDFEALEEDLFSDTEDSVPENTGPESG